MLRLTFDVPSGVVSSFNSTRRGGVRWLPRRSTGGWALPRLATTHVETAVAPLLLSSPTTRRRPSPKQQQRRREMAAAKDLPAAESATVEGDVNTFAAAAAAAAATAAPVTVASSSLPRLSNIPHKKKKTKERHARRRSWKGSDDYRIWWLAELADVDHVRDERVASVQSQPRTPASIAAYVAVTVAVAAAADAAARVSIADAKVNAAATVAMMRDDGDDDEDDADWVDGDLAPLADIPGLRGQFKKGMSSVRDEGTLALKEVVVAFARARAARTKRG